MRINNPGVNDKEIKDRISQAKYLEQQFGPGLLQAPRINELINRLKNAAQNTFEKMGSLNIINTCSLCARKHPGGCCFNGVEEWFDSRMLLINLLLGIQFPEQRKYPDGCFFLGDKGCLLLSRHPFCINFYCPNLKNETGPDSMNLLNSLAAKESVLQLELEGCINSWLEHHDID